MPDDVSEPASDDPSDKPTKQPSKKARGKSGKKASEKRSKKAGVQPRRETAAKLPPQEAPADESSRETAVAATGLETSPANAARELVPADEGHGQSPVAETPAAAPSADHKLAPSDEVTGELPPAPTSGEVAPAHVEQAPAPADEAAAGDQVAEEVSSEAAPLTAAPPRASGLAIVMARRYWRPLSIFAIALFVRLFYNLVVLDFRVCHLGAASNSVNTAADLLEWLWQGAGFQALLTVHDAGSRMGSLSLFERLLAGGPVFPVYLAFLAVLFQIGPSAADFSSHGTQFAVVNSLVDSISCCLVYYAGRLAFDRRTALLAGCLMALYPPAIINTQHCCSEPFAGLLLTVWTCLLLTAFLRHLGGEGRNRLVWSAFGLVTALLMLVGPAFFALPLVVFAALGASRMRAPFKPRYVIMLLAGLAALLVPWLCFTSLANGSPALFAGRVVIRDLLAGNRLATDGWGTIAADSSKPSWSEAARAIGQSAADKPWEFLGLQLRKLPRLWAGGWNDFQYNLPFLDVYEQEILHEVLLFCAALGATLAVSGPGFRRLARASRSGVALIAIALFHFVYLLFEPVSRNNFTAVPAVVLLASYAVIHFAGQSRRLKWRLVMCIIAAGFLLRLLQGGSSLYAYLAGIFPKGVAFLFPFADGLFWACTWLAVWKLILPLVAENQLISRAATASRCLAVVFFVLGAVELASCIGCPERKEWWTDLRTPGQIVRQDIYLPPVAAASSLGQQAVVLLDLESPALLPQLAVAVNGERLDPLPLTWLQVEGGHDRLLAALASQARAMGRDMRSFRQWWVLPIPTALLRFDASNAIMIKSLSTDWVLPTRIYGDYSAYGLGSSEVPRILPSLSTMSLAKGFQTYDHHDARIYEPVRLLGKETGSHWFEQRDWSNSDLSQNPGRQIGEFRIRLGLVEKATAPGGIEPGPAGLAKPATEEPPQTVQFAPISLAQVSGPQTVAGWDLSSMMLTKSRLALPPNIPSGALFLFSCELRDFEPYGSAMVSVQFLGEEDGKPVTWSSLWQPSRIPLTQAWTSVSFSDIIPDRILRLDNLRVNIIVSPYHADQMLTQPWRALRETAAVQDASLLILPPLQMPAPEQRVWMFY